MVVLIMGAITDPALLCDLYLRRSNWQDDKTTLRKHERDLRERAAREGLTVRKVWIEEVSAFKAGVVREKFDNAIAAVVSGVVRHLLVWKLDRLSRQGMGQVGTVLDQFEQKGARLVAHIDGLDSSIPQHRGLFAWLAEQARSESFNTSTRTQSTKAEKKLTGDWPGGQAPYGLCVRKRRTRHNRKEYPTSRRIADALLQNRSGEDIAEELNSEGLRTRRGGLWRSSTIHQLAHSPAWAGLMPAHERYEDKKGRIRWRATDEPLIGEDGQPVRTGDGVITVAERARILAGLRLRTSESFSGGRRGKPGANSLLSSFGKCGRCGGNMTKSGQQYRCYRRVNLGKSACQGMTVLVKDLDWAISAAFRARVQSFSPEHAVFKELAARWLAHENPEAEARRVELIGMTADAQSRLDSLDDAYYVKGRFGDANGEHRYLKLREAIVGQLDSANSKLAELKESMDLSALMDPTRLHSAWLSADQEKARMLLRVVLHSFTVLPPRGQGCKRNRFELLSECCFHWVGEKQQPLRRDVERISGIVLLDEEAESMGLAA
ncbi:recombinase family protein [Streptomyces murinus]|uniref:recombinase family protein n=1 Tax=Streptomyces murinus TaxID=33900 RepID=UPI00381B76D5